MIVNWEKCRWGILEGGKSDKGSRQAQEIPAGESGGFLSPPQSREACGERQSSPLPARNSV